MALVGQLQQISDFVELLVLSFCFIFVEVGNHLPIISPHPVCLLILGCSTLVCN